MAIRIVLNGQSREFADAKSIATVSNLIAALELKSDRVAVELNGDLAPRTDWEQIEISDGDRVELVHFVGGGAEC